MYRKCLNIIGTLIVSCAFISCDTEDIHDAMFEACEAQYRVNDLCDLNFKGNVSYCIDSLEDARDELLRSPVGHRCDGYMKRYLHCMTEEYNHVRRDSQCFDFIYDYEDMCLDELDILDDCIDRYEDDRPDDPEDMDDSDSIEPDLNDLYSLAAHVCRLEGTLINKCTDNFLDVNLYCTYSNQINAVDSLLKGHSECRHLYQTQLECEYNMYFSINNNCNTFNDQAYYIPDDAPYDPTTGQYEAHGWLLQCESQRDAFDRCLR